MRRPAPDGAATTGSNRCRSFCEPSVPTCAHVWPRSGLAKRRSASSANVRGCVDAGRSATSSTSSTSRRTKAPHAGVRRRLGDGRRSRRPDRRRRRRNAGRSAATACGAGTAPTSATTSTPDVGQRRQRSVDRSITQERWCSATTAAEIAHAERARPPRSRSAAVVAGTMRSTTERGERARRRRSTGRARRRAGRRPRGPARGGAAPLSSHVVERGDDRCRRAPVGGGRGPAAITAAAPARRARSPSR